MNNAEIIVVRRLDNGIYASSGGGQTAVWSRHGSGPRSLCNAVSAHHQERQEADRYYGSIGKGVGWVEAVPRGGEPGDGIRIDHPLFGMEPEHLPTPPTGGAPLSWWQQQVQGAWDEHR